jgi:hypothetical protein
MLEGAPEDGASGFGFGVLHLERTEFGTKGAEGFMH